MRYAEIVLQCEEIHEIKRLFIVNDPRLISVDPAHSLCPLWMHFTVKGVSGPSALVGRTVGVNIPGFTCTGHYPASHSET